MPVVSKTTVRLYPRDVELIDAWAAANPDPDTGEIPSRPTAIRRMIREHTGCPTDLSPVHANDPATRADLQSAVSRILDRLAGGP